MRASPEEPREDSHPRPDGEACVAAGHGLRPAADQRLFAIPVDELTDPPQSIPTRIAEALYRVAELVGAAALLIVTSPILLIEALLIRLDSPGPVLFLHTRLGQSEKRYGRELVDRSDIKPPAGGFEPDRLYWVPTTFQFVKFRTMIADAPIRYPELYWWNFEIDEEKFGEMYYKVEADPRLTRVGKWLRKSTLDELPNFFSVISGHTRLVGPRPEAPGVAVHYSQAQMRKFAIKPGITCLSKIYGRGELTVGAQIALDMEYVRTRSLWLDLKILVKTLTATLSRRGAF